MFGWLMKIGPSLFGETEAARSDREVMELIERVGDAALMRAVTDPEFLKNAATYQPAVISSLPTAISSVPSQGLLRSPE